MLMMTGGVMGREGGRSGSERVGTGRVSVVVAVVGFVILVVGGISTCSAQESSKLLGVYRGTCLHFDKEKLVAAVYVLTGFGGYMALYDDGGGCSHIMADYVYNDTTLTSSLILQAEQGWSCTNVTRFVATLGPDGHQVQGRIADGKGLRSHCDLVEVIREHPLSQHRLKQEEKEEKEEKRQWAQPNHTHNKHPSSSLGSPHSSIVPSRRGDNPVVPAAFSGRCESDRHPCHVSAQIITGVGLAQGVGYLWWWGSCNDTAYDCLYICNSVDPIGGTATDADAAAATAGVGFIPERNARNVRFSVALERFDNYGVAACPELKSGSHAVFSAENGHFNITATSKHAHRVTYHMSLVPDVLPSSSSSPSSTTP